MQTIRGSLVFDEQGWKQARTQAAAVGAEGNAEARTLRFEVERGVDDLVWDLAQSAVGGSLEITRDGHRWHLNGGWATRHFDADPGGRLTLPDASAHHLAFSPDGTLLAVVVTQGWGVQVVVMETETGRVRHVFSAREGDSLDRDRTFDTLEYAARAAFSADGAKLVCAGMDDHVRVWNLADGALLHRHRLPRKPAAVAASSAVLALVLRGDDSSLLLLDPFDPTTELPGSRDQSARECRGLELDGDALLVSERYDARRVDPKTGETTSFHDELRSLRAHGELVAGVRRERKGAWAVVLKKAGSTVCEVPLRYAQHLCFVGDHLYALGSDALVRIDPSDGSSTTVFERSPTQLFDGDLQLHDGALYLGLGASVVRVDLGSDLASQLPPVTTVKERRVAPDGARVAVSAFLPDSNRRHLAIVDAELSRQVALLEGDLGAWSPDGSVFAFVHENEARYLDRDGQLLGAVPLATTERPYDPKLDGHELLVAKLGSEIVAFDAGSGLERWRVPGDAFDALAGHVVVRERYEAKRWSRVVDGALSPLPADGHPTLLADGAVVLAADDALRCFDVDGAERWSHPFTAFVDASLDPRFVGATRDGEHLLLDAATGEILTSACPHVFGFVATCTLGGGLLSVGNDGHSFGLEPRTSFEHEPYVERLRQRLAEGAAARDAADSAPLEELPARLPVEGHAPLPPTETGDDFVRFSKPEQPRDDEEEYEEDEDGEEVRVLYRSDERVWKRRYDAGGDDELGDGDEVRDYEGPDVEMDRVRVFDGEGHEVGSWRTPSMVDLKVVAGGRLALARIDDTTTHMFRMSTSMRDPEDTPEDVALTAVTLFVHGDDGEERAKIVPKARGPYLEIRELEANDTHLVLEMHHDGGGALEVWSLDGEHVFSLEEELRAWSLRGDQLVVLAAHGDYWGALRRYELPGEAIVAEHLFEEDRDNVIALEHGAATLGGGRLTFHDADLSLTRELALPAKDGRVSDDGETWISEGFPEPRRWRLADGRPLHDHANNLARLAAHAGRVASLDFDEELIVRELSGEVVLRTNLQVTGGSGDSSVALTTDHVAFTDRAGRFRVVDLRSGAARSSSLEVAAVASDGDVVWTADRGGVLRAWDPETGEQTRSVSVGLIPKRLQVRGDGALLIAEDQDYVTRAHLVSLEDGRELGSTQIGHSDSAASLSPDGTSFLVARSGDGGEEIVLVDAQREKVLSSDARAAAFVDEKRALLATWDDTKLLDLESGDTSPVETISERLSHSAEGVLVVLSSHGFELRRFA